MLQQTMGSQFPCNYNVHYITQILFSWWLIGALTDHILSHQSQKLKMACTKTMNRTKGTSRKRLLNVCRRYCKYVDQATPPTLLSSSSTISVGLSYDHNFGCLFYQLWFCYPRTSPMVNDHAESLRPFEESSN